MHERIGVPSVETRSSWTIATVLLVILALSFWAPWITIVALKLIAAESDGLRAVPALATSLAWLGFGAGGIAMGYVAERIEKLIEHVVMKADEHAVAGRANVDLVAVGAQCQRRAVCFERVFVSEFRCAAVTNNGDAGAPRCNALVPRGVRVLIRLRGDCTHGGERSG